MARNRCRARTVKPKFLTRLFGHGDKAFTRARVRHAHDFRGRLCDSVFIVANDVANQHHFWQVATAAFGRITDRAQITFVQMLQTRQNRARGFRGFKQIIFDFNNRWNRFTRLPKKLQTHGARVFRHGVQHPACAGDQAVRAFFLHTR